MRVRYTLSFVLLTLFISAASWAKDDIVVYEFINAATGIRQIFHASEAILSKVPEWIPDKDDPPLRIPAAASIAKKWAMKQYPKFDALVVRQVELSRIGWLNGGNRWFYVFSFDPQMYGERYLSTSIYAVVLMDGTALPLKTEKTRQK